MAETLGHNRAAWLVAGLFVGIALGSMLPQTPLYASATHGQEGFAVATVEVDTGIEGVVFLDGLTGDLKGVVINVQSQKFQVAYERNITADFAAAGVKSPKFLMVSGQAELRSTAGKSKMSKGIIYIAEITSGQVVAYGMPFPQGPSASAKLPFTPLDSAKLRTVAVRPGG